ncbi:MAG: aldo/keto reductase [Acidobacteria bacterium]|nr:MAG: aldo/keto reductase [Acidobacteriota bacterium]REK01948.1 MAG: aldo/keto reductase [Acidobacteriota bacterium]REK14904.1 MAG: aldo/keto reductase [Acidobacteriota bacterium]REK45619.1 MAG: aldo/keto reductase [Acidobacteriota bacterium]
MRTRKLGGLKVSAIGLGCMGMSEFYGTPDEVTSVEVIHRALDVGINFLDTADMYGLGANEELVGRAVKGKRDQFIIATKFAFIRDRDDHSIKGISGKPEYVAEAVERSLKRLGIETIDLYYQHRVDPEVPVEETIGAMSKLVDQGKVRYLGMSEASADSIRRANQVHPIAALQSEYSIWTRDVETNGVLETCRELGIGFVPYAPLGRGFLTGALKTAADLPEGDARRLHPRFNPENFARNLELVRQVEEIAREKGIAASQLALAWTLAQGDNIVPIPGTKQIRYLESNAAAADIELTESELDRIERVFPRDAASGARYTKEHFRYVQS